MLQKAKAIGESFVASSATLKYWHWMQPTRPKKTGWQKQTRGGPITGDLFFLRGTTGESLEVSTFPGFGSDSLCTDRDL